MEHDKATTKTENFLLTGAWWGAGGSLVYNNIHSLSLKTYTSKNE